MSSAQQGAQAGSAFGPWGTVIGYGVGAAVDYQKEGDARDARIPGNFSGGFMGGYSPTAAMETYGTGLDGSGWVVNFGGEQSGISTASTKAYERRGDTVPTPVADMLESAGTAAWVVPLGLVAAAMMLILLRKRKT